MVRLFFSTVLRSRSFWAVLVVLSSLELVLVFTETSLSKDVTHLKEIPGVVSTLAARNGYRVLFIGNSLVRAGLRDLEAVGRAAGVPCLAAAAIHPDDSSMFEWLHLYRALAHDDVQRSWHLARCDSGWPELQLDPSNRDGSSGESEGRRPAAPT